MKIILLGNSKISKEYTDQVYHFLWKEKSINNVNKNIIYESDYLNEQQLDTSYKHLAEYSAFYTFWKYNPLNLKDEDVLCFISSRKFEEMCNISVEDIIKFQDKIEEICKKKAVYAFSHHVYNFDYRGDEPSHLIKREYVREILKDVRTVFHNYPQVGKHYFCFSYKSLCDFSKWVYEKLFLKFFNEDFSEKLDENKNPIIKESHFEGERFYDIFRAFGIIMEHYHHKFFWDEKYDLYFHPHNNPNPSFLYKLNYIDEYLDWTSEKIDI